MTHRQCTSPMSSSTPSLCTRWTSAPLYLAPLHLPCLHRHDTQLLSLNVTLETDRTGGVGLQFQQTDRGWRERLVDVAQEGDANHLRLVLAPQDTPASKLLLSRRLQGLPPGAGDFPQAHQPGCHNA